MRNFARTHLVLLLLAMSATSAIAQSTSAIDAPGTAFAEANVKFESGDYEEAIASYEKLVAAGVVNSDLFYNLANAHYKLGNLGYAVLFYERALLLAPRDEDIRQNLTLVTSLLGDRQFVESKGALKRITTGWHHNLSTRESFLLASTMYVLLTLSLVLLIFRRADFVILIYGKLSLISPGRFMGLEKTQDMIMVVCTLLVLTSITGASAGMKRNADTSRARAVVVVEEVAVYSGPNVNATLQFNVHHGTSLRVVETRPGWGQIELPGDLSGWIELDALERI